MRLFSVIEDLATAYDPAFCGRRQGSPYAAAELLAIRRPKAAPAGPLIRDGGTQTRAAPLSVLHV